MEWQDDQIKALLAAWPEVRIDRDNAAFYAGLLEQRLLINRCNDCGHWHHPPRPVCPECWSTSLTPTEPAGTGRIMMFTLLRQGPPSPAVDYTNGHPVASIELDEQPGLCVAGTVIGLPSDQLQIDDLVQVVWRDIDGRPPRPDFEVMVP